MKQIATGVAAKALGHTLAAKTAHEATVAHQVAALSARVADLTAKTQAAAQMAAVDHHLTLRAVRAAEITARATWTAAAFAFLAALATSIYAYYTMKLWKGSLETTAVWQGLVKSSQESTKAAQDLARQDQVWKVNRLQQEPNYLKLLDLWHKSYFHLAALAFAWWLIRPLLQNTTRGETADKPPHR